MEFRDLCNYEPITIQCHDNPDADAIASAYAMYCYFKANNKQSRIIYCGRPIHKPNLRIMINKLNIPIMPYEATDERIEGLLLLVDCQYQESNVTRLEADYIAEIDHHNSKSDLSKVIYFDIQPQLGSCSTLVWQKLMGEGFFEKRDSVLETALYYGLMTDTENFVEAHHPLDLDMRDFLNYEKMTISNFCNSNISLNELEVAAVALLRNNYNINHRCAVAASRPCDPNLLGMIIDLIKTVDGIDACVVYSDCGSGYKYSVRSCISEIRANELAEYLAKGIGSGGGHVDKAGGFCDKELFEALDNSLDFDSYLNMKMAEYFDNTEIIRASEYDMDISSMQLYTKKRIVLGYIDPTEFVAKGSPILIRTLEGDVSNVVDGTYYIMIGVLGEVYPIKKDKFLLGYTPVDKEYSCTFDYDPVLHTINDSGLWNLRDYAHSCEVTSKVSIYAKKLQNYVKVFTQWDPEGYMYGRPGDYIACRNDDHHDIYVIRGDIFDKTYERL